MPVDISKLTITTPVATSATNPLALELNGALAAARLPEVVSLQPDETLRLSAPTRGASSKSTRRTRCEWKEPGYWTLDSAAVHRNHQRMRLVKVNAAQKVVVAQMHVKDDDSPPIKVFWNKGRITFGFRGAFDQPAPTNSTLLANVPLAADYEVNIQVDAAGSAIVSATCNGASATSGPLQLERSWFGHAFNFHGGVYNQLDYDESTPAEDGSVCVISELALSHGTRSA
ncbi:polysaccharide lyase family 7 protein [Pseudomonas aeruginosa]